MTAPERRSMSPQKRARLLKAFAAEEGFLLAGICRADPSGHGGFLDGWIEEGRHGEMRYLAEPDARARRVDLGLTLPEVRSVLVVAHNYHQEDPEGVPGDPARGVVARYARGRDYHRVVKKGLQRVHRRFQELTGADVPARVYVDTGPILERELASRAGLGWFGRNTMLIHPRKGSYFFLGVLLLAVDVEPDPPFEEDHCGSCRACLDACPTGALLGRDEAGAPVMDATRCISYLTIENPGPIPRELRPLMGNRVYGCDICQEVCPFNVRFAEPAAEPGYAARGPGERPVGVEALPEEDFGSPTPMDVFPDPRTDLAPAHVWLRRALCGSAETPPDPCPLHPGTDGPPLIELLTMALSEEAWESFSRGSAIRRAGRAGFARNVCVGLGNWGSESVVPVLVEALSDPAPLVRGHAVWALGRIGSPDAREALSVASESETDPFVREELSAVSPG